MIVDDEELSRELIKNCIDWKKNGFDIINEASNPKDVFSND